MLFAETLARRTVPVEELKMSTKLGLSIQIITLFSDQNIIKDTIQHLDTVLRRIEEASSNRAKVFHKVSKTKF